jgi:hypothetical protein
MSPEEISLIATALFLIISETLPFVSKYKGNGVLHIISLLLRFLVKQDIPTEEPNTEEQND